MGGCRAHWSRDMTRVPTSMGRNYADGMEVGAVAASRAPGPSRVGSSGNVELLGGGMHCQSGAALIQETVLRDPGIDRSAVDLGTARAQEPYDPASISVEALCAAIASAGYAATALTSGDPALSC